MIESLKEFISDIKALRADIKALKVDRVSKKGPRESAEVIGQKWFDAIKPKVTEANVCGQDVVEKYDAAFKKLISLSGPNNLKSSYLKALDIPSKGFKTDLLLPAQSGMAKPKAETSSFDAFLVKLAASDEGDYFKEALSCAKHGYLRAAAVMAWCTAIDRIHRKIDEIGFTTFNVTSAKMASQTAGRFKRFNQTQNVNSLSELRNVFDNTVLWITEGMGLIDSNQHMRLSSCFEMRCHAAHPGEAPITPFNLLSLFSDIDQIVLLNQKFALSLAGAVPANGSAG